MVELDDIRLYLPKYLSFETEQKLLSDLTDFPENIDKRLYGFIGKKPNVIYQGDGIKNLPFINLPNKEIREVNSVIISNTCDVDINNIRKFNSNLIYTPLFKLEKYRRLLINNNIYNEESINGHIEQIRKQRITQIFYFPVGQGIEESIIFFDRICHCDNKHLDRQSIKDIRLFSLSQYGFYLFLYKLSIHFTRFHERVDRMY